VSLRKGDLAKARVMYEEVLAGAAHESNDLAVADTRVQLAWIAALAGAHEDAARLTRDALAQVGEDVQPVGWEV
jgi:hypothetical protein